MYKLWISISQVEGQSPLVRYYIINTKTNKKFLSYDDKAKAEKYIEVLNTNKIQSVS